jgi:hypothetical protein
LAVEIEEKLEGVAAMLFAEVKHALHAILSVLRLLGSGQGVATARS